MRRDSGRRLDCGDVGAVIIEHASEVVPADLIEQYTIVSDGAPITAEICLQEQPVLQLTAGLDAAAAGDQVMVDQHGYTHPLIISGVDNEQVRNSVSRRRVATERFMTNEGRTLSAVACWPCGAIRITFDQVLLSVSDLCHLDNTEKMITLI